MGREIKRVPVDFDWPLEQIWAGYVNPYTPVKCRVCEGSGESIEYKKLCDDWYGWGKPRYAGSQYHLTQEEVMVLIADHRLRILTHIWTKEDGYKRKLNEDGSEYVPSTDEVNEWAKRYVGHDSINQWIVCKHRADKAGIDVNCPQCKGEGHFWQSEEIKKANDEWERIPVPDGDGWQVWETVSEGSPITPVFPTGEELVEYLVENGDLWCQRRPNELPPSREAATRFVFGSGWVPSGAIIGNEFKTNINCAEDFEDDKEE